MVVSPLLMLINPRNQKWSYWNIIGDSECPSSNKSEPVEESRHPSLLALRDGGVSTYSSLIVYDV
jgi:hypothetical protein